LPQFFARKGEYRANVLIGDAVFTADSFNCVSAGQCARMVATGVRVPEMTGLPWQIAGSMAMRGFMAAL
jgi:hypothetical protein